MSKVKEIASLFATRRGRRPVRRPARRPWMAQPERLESRALLTVTPTLVSPGVLQISYDELSDQQAIVELESAGTHNTGRVDFTADVNVYAPSNAATTPSSWFFPNISQIIVTVTGYDTPGINNNSLAIKGINTTTDRIIVGGSGRTAAGRWSSETADGDQCLLSIEGIDDLTITAGGTINVSGDFTNDTDDASIRVIGQVVERAADQQTATVTIGETTPSVGNVSPKPWLFSNFIVAVGAELDIYGDIRATDSVDLRAGDSAPGGSRSNLVLPYNITVSGNAVTGDGLLSLFSTRNISQLQTSTILAPRVVAVSNADRATAPDGPWMIDLGTATNDFDQISIGMVAAPGDAPVAATEGRVGIRDVDDLTVADFGILAATGRVRIDTAGKLTLAAPIQATGLVIESDDSVVSDAGAALRLGDQGISILANATFDPSSTGDVTLAGPVTINDTDATALVTNKIIAAGTITVAGGFYSPLAGSTTFSGTNGVVIGGPVQVGSTKLDANSTTITVFDHDLNLISLAGDVTVNDAPGNDAIPRTIQATNLISFDAAQEVSIAGSVFAGTLYGNPLALVETKALPAITIVAGANVDITATGSLQTSTYENKADAHPNPTLGLISISEASQVNLDGRIIADGAVIIGSGVTGDVYLYGPVTARESITVATTAGSIDLQGAMRTTGYTYTTTLPAPLQAQRTPDITLSAPLGGISTSGLGTLSAGVMTLTVVGEDSTTTAGTIALVSQQDITIAANVVTAGAFKAASKLGAFELDSLLQTGSAASATIAAATGVREVEFGRIVTASLDASNTTDGDISLLAVDNRIAALTAQNFAAAGKIDVLNNADVAVGVVRANGDISLTNSSTLTLRNAITSSAGKISASSTAGDVVLQGTLTAVDATSGSISIVAQKNVTQTTGGIVAVNVLAGGAGYTTATTVVIAAPAAAGGTAATGRAVIGTVNGVAGVITGIEIITPGSGYAAGEQANVTITGVGVGAAALATAAVVQTVVAGDDVTIAAGLDVTLLNTLSSASGDITIQSTNGNLLLGSNTFFAHALAGSVILDSDCGTVVVERACAGLDVTLTGDKGVTVERDVDAGRDITVTANAGPATVTDFVAGRDIKLTGQTATVTDLTAGNAITVTSQGLATVNGDVLANAGAIDVTSTAGAINLTANLAAALEVTLDAAASVIQPSASGISLLTLSAGGSGYTAGAVVTIAPPVGGGTAARATAVVSDGVVTALIITNPGSGYAVGESPLVTIAGNLVGGGNDGPAREAGSGAAAVASGPTAIPGVKGKAVTVRGDAGVSLNSFVIASDGAIVIESSYGSLSVDSGSVLLQADKGSVTLNADAGFVAVRNVLSRDDIDVAGFNAVSLAGEIRSSSGDIAAESVSGSITLAANVRADSGQLRFKSHGSITQATESGLSGIELITGGTGYTLGATVTIAAPVGGGVAAKAVATLENGVVTKLTLTDAGSGYAVGESPSVTISGGATAGAVQGSGAAARASGPVAQQQVRAGNGIDFEAGTGIALRSTIVTDKGDINATTRTGNLNLDSGALTLQALSGDVLLRSDTGVVSAQRLLAADKITVTAYSDASVIGEAKAGSTITVTAEAGKVAVANLTAGDAIFVSGKTAVSLAGEIKAGGSNLTATSSAGTVQFSANISVEKDIKLTAGGSVNQLNSTGISSVTLRAGGSGYTQGAKVTIAPPAGGGIAASAEAVIEFGVITGIIITQPGSGYAVGESPAVTITGNLSAGGGGPNPTPPAPVGGGASAVATGPLTSPRVVAGEEIVIDGNTGVALNSLIESKGKNISVKSASGVLSLDAASLKMKAKEGITLQTDLAAIAAGNLYAGDLVKVNAAGNLSLVGEIQSAGTGLDLESTRGAVTLGANLLAGEGSISVKAAASLVQIATGGLSGLQLTAGGSGYTSRVVVTIAPPRGTGVAAQAAAVVTDGAITGLILTAPGSGYAVGETPAVTFAAGPADGLNPGGGGTGAAARAIGPVSLPQIFAKDNVTIASGSSATLTTLVRSTEGDVSIRSTTGDLALSSGSFSVVTESAASAVAFQADTGSVNLRRVDAAGSITVSAGQSAVVSALSAEGAVTIEAGSGATVEQRIESGGKASISALNGPVKVGDVFADNGIDVKTGAGFLLQRVLRSDNAGISIESVQDIALGTSTTDSSVIALGGDITAKTKASGIALDARLVATGRITLVAQGAVTQAFGTGVTRFIIVNGGLSRVLPTVTLTVAGPAAGGEAATATAVVGSRQIGTDVNGLPVFNYFIESILVTNVGRGYAVGENPIVTVTGIQGAVIQAFGPVALRTLDAGAGVTVAGGDDVSLVNTVTASVGDIAVSSVSGNLLLGADTFFAHALAGSVILDSDCGTVVVERACAGLDVTVTGENGVSIEQDIVAGRDIQVTAAAGPATVTNLSAGNAITVSSQELATVSGDVVAKAGAIAVTSTAGGIDLTANVRALSDSVTLTANLGLLQTVSSGLTDLVLLNGGGARGDEAPTVTVLIAAPTDPRGVAATASATVVQVRSDGFGPLWSITNLVITNPGSGYAPGESPQVTIAGMPNAAAQAIVRNAGTVGTLVAERDLTVVAGGDVEAVSTFRANTGDVTIRSIAGSLLLGADTFLAQSVAGSVTLQSDASTVTIERVASGVDATITGTRGVIVEQSTVAGRDIVVAASAGPATVTDLIAGRAVTATSNGLVSLNGDVVATTGAITVTSAANAIDLRADMNAAGDSIALTANLGVVQSVNSGVARVNVVSGGQAVGATPPTVTVTIAGPVAGGTAATGQAVLTQTGQTGNTPLWAITQIIITNPGSGYTVNESPLVTITGMPGASAIAFSRSSDPAVMANKNLTVAAGGDVTLISTFQAATGDVAVASTNGNLDLAAETFLASASQGNVTISSATGKADLRNVYAGKNVAVAAAGTVTLLGVVDSDAGDISITSRNRDLDFTASEAQIHAFEGGVTLAAPNGSILSPPTLHVSKNATLTSFNTLVLNNEITSDTGVIDLQSTSGSINLNANLDARDDSIKLTAKGSVTQIGGGIGFVRVSTGGSGYTAAATITIAAPSSGTGVAARATPIIGRVNGVNGVITGIRLVNPGSGYGAGEQPLVTINRNATPPAGATDAAAIAVASPALGNSGLAAIDVLAGGSGYTPTTVVTIAAPAGGGTAATALPVIGTLDGVAGVIVDIVIVNPGSGYGAGEQPAVTITGAGTRAVARAIANITLQDIRAGQNIDIVAGTGITLLNTVRADLGDVTITTDTGNVNLAARTQLVSSFGGDIDITARRGAIVAQRLAADGDITLSAQTGVTLLNAVNSTGAFGTGDVSITTVNGNIAAVAPNALISVLNGGVSLDSVNGQIFTPPVLNVVGDIALRMASTLNIVNSLTSQGDITLESRNGSVAVGTGANLVANDRVTVLARQGVTQDTGFIKARELVVTNATTLPVNLTNSSNDVDNLSIMSVGAVSYTDANDFEVGVNRVGPLGVEVSGDSVQLTSAAAYSTIRVVSGLKYRSLAIGAGNLTGPTVGTVEFVTTSKADNPALGSATPTFAGTLRDMIRYVNDNVATYTSSLTVRSQPMALVFDEAGYDVNTITLAPTTALPTFNRPVTFDGGRLTEDVLTTGQSRLGITVAAGNSLPYGLAFAPAIAAIPGKLPAYPGSGGSRIEDVALYGFTKGAALVLGSANNTVANVYAGLKADGTSDLTTGNFVGVDISGATATGNQIGTAVVQADTVNRFGGNTSAGILIRNNASGTRVFGSIIGDDTGVTPTLANGDGIRISAATANQIGAADAVQPDQVDSVSNVIAGNKGSGVAIVNSTAGSVGAANVVANNRIEQNRVGVSISGSRFAILGGGDGKSGNTIVSQASDGIALTNALDVQVLGNRVGVRPATAFTSEALAGNGGNGVAITGTSQGVRIASGNRISANAFNGVSIGTGVTAVNVTGNTIGGVYDDGTGDLKPAGNGVDGVAINAAVGNTIGVGNMISRNGRHGVSVVDARAADPTAGNRILGSTITDNAFHGVYASGGSNSTIGGTAAGDRNVIRSNAGSGIYLEPSARTGVPTGFAVQGNLVGTNTNRDVDGTLGNLGGGIVVEDATGMRIEGNTVMNSPSDGITIRGGSGNVVGGPTAALGNRVTNNQRDGIRVVNSATQTATGHWITGNTITDNQTGNGVTVNGARGITVGQSVTTAGVKGLGNTIQRNAVWGVRVENRAQQVSIQGNSIAGNGFRGIGIEGGSNTSTAAGITLSKATIRQRVGSQLQIQLQGQLTGLARGQQYSIDVYANPAQDAAQGRRFLGRVTFTATANGSFTWGTRNPLTLSANVAVGERITATVTALRVEPGSTSNLSGGVVATR